MSRNYYALVAGLPDILLDESRLPVSQIAFRTELREQLAAPDQELVDLFFYRYDHANLLARLEKKEQAHDERGVFSAEALEEELRSPTQMPPYMQRFVEAFRSGEPLDVRLSRENQLTALYYEYLLSSEVPFVREYFSFERDLRNVLAALACRNMEREVDSELIGDNEVTDSIRKSNAGDFGLGREHPWLENVLRYYGEMNLLEREKGLDSLRWQVLDDAVLFHYFSIERILAYLVKLGIAERWLALDPETGGKLFNSILEELEAGFRFPPQYSVSGGR